MIGSPSPRRSGGRDDLASFAESKAFAVERDDVAVVQEAVKDRGRGCGVGQELGPEFEVDVRGDRDRALFVGGGDEAEQVVGEMLRVLAGCAAGVKPDADPVNGSQ